MNDFPPRSATLARPPVPPARRSPAAEAAAGSLRRVWGLMFRHLALFRRSWPRLVELAYWPTLQMLIWGFTSTFFASRLGSAGAVTVGLLLGGVLLWEVTLRAQMGMSITFLEELWSRNLGHVFVSPLRPWEMVAALLGMSALRMLCGVLPAAVLAWLLYGFDLVSVGPALPLFVAALMVMGWSVALMVMAIILRHGQGAEAFAWSVLFGFTPLSAVFYPVSALPAAVRPLAFALPSSHVFEGMRAALSGHPTPWGQLGWAGALDALWLVVAVWVFAGQFTAARRSGALLSIGE